MRFYCFKKTETADYSVMIVAGLSGNGDIYIMDCIRDRFDFPELKRMAVGLNARWRGQGLRGFYIEDKASGQSLIQELRTESGISVIPVKVSTDKVSRVNAVTPLIEGGRVFIPEKAHWLDDFMNEMQTFPNGKHDDIVDAMSMALDAMAKMGGQTAEMINLPINMGNSLHASFAKKSITSYGKSDPFKGWGEL